MCCGGCVLNSKFFDKIRCQEIILGRDDHVVFKGNALLMIPNITIRERLNDKFNIDISIEEIFIFI